MIFICVRIGPHYIRIENVASARIQKMHTIDSDRKFFIHTAIYQNHALQHCANDRKWTMVRQSADKIM